MRYLRVRNEDGDYVIISLKFDELIQKIIRNKFGWEGRNYDKAEAHHLGVIDKSLPRQKTGSIDVTQHPGAGYTGYGFGNRVNKDDVQGYVWAGKPVAKTVLEFAVTDREVTAEEKAKLLKDE